MTITAKYAATCPVCNCAITPGQQIEWSKGTKARHTACAGAGAGATVTSTRVLVADMPRPRRSAGRGRWTGCSCGSREDAYGELIRSERNCFSCNHDA